MLVDMIRILRTGEHRQEQACLPTCLSSPSFKKFKWPVHLHNICATSVHLRRSRVKPSMLKPQNPREIYIRLHLATLFPEVVYEYMLPTDDHSSISPNGTSVSTTAWQAALVLVLDYVSTVQNAARKMIFWKRCTTHRRRMAESFLPKRPLTTSGSTILLKPFCETRLAARLGHSSSTSPILINAD